MKKTNNKKKKELNKKKSSEKKKSLKNKEIQAKEKTGRDNAASDQNNTNSKAESISAPRKAFRIIKNIIFIIVFVSLAVAMVTFLIVRMNGGTPNVFGYSLQRIISGSMEPTLHVGDIILSKEVKSPDEIHTDDIITFKGDSYFDYNSVTHRVVIPPEQNMDGIYVLNTKGDANEDLDPEISFSSVQSIYIQRVEILRKFYDFFLSPWGLIVFIGALLVIFFDEILTIARVVTGNYNEEEDESIKEIMARLKKEEIEEYLKKMQEEEKKKSGEEAEEKSAVEQEEITDLEQEEPSVDEPSDEKSEELSEEEPSEGKPEESFEKEPEELDESTEETDAGNKPAEDNDK